MAARELRLQSQPQHVNIMVWGGSGLGKTTFIKNFIRGFPIKSKGEALAAGTKTSHELFRDNPDSMRLETEPIPAGDDKPTGTGIILSIQDTPGWDDDVNLVDNLKTVVRFLLKQRQADLTTHHAGSTEHNSVPGTVREKGITVCLCFLTPHRSKEVDWVMMEAISSLVAVVPVIAKADCHTADEMEAYKREILQIIQDATSRGHAAAAAAAAAGDAGPQELRSQPGASSSSSSTTGLVHPFRFKPSGLTALNVSQGTVVPPFCSHGLTECAGSWEDVLGPAGTPCRKYLWGTAVPSDPRHSDLIILQQLLTGHQNQGIQ